MSPSRKGMVAVVRSVVNDQMAYGPGSLFFCALTSS